METETERERERERACVLGSAHHSLAFSTVT